MNEVEYSARSARDLGDLLRYIAAQDPVVADKVSNAIRAAVARLSENPRLAISAGELRVARYPLKKYGITIFIQHLPRKRIVRIVRIVRGSRVRRLGVAPA